VLEEFISRAAAREDYAVVLGAGDAVDEKRRKYCAHSA